ILGVYMVESTNRNSLIQPKKKKKLDEEGVFRYSPLERPRSAIAEQDLLYPSLSDILKLSGAALSKHQANKSGQ
ncbi:hypothetical protein ACQ1Z1_14185, partial [Enterococcus faecalis]|uniref:hypothetical protein n=1 Tax=Enterococcus faecalis TaxID=1351 RepID=UPI003D6C4BAE